MTLHTVIWEIQVEADSKREAAQKALEIQRDPDSTATVFNVYDAKDGDLVDLSDTVEMNPDLEKAIRAYMANCAEGNDGLMHAGLIVEATRSHFGEIVKDFDLTKLAIDAIHNAE